MRRLLGMITATTLLAVNAACDRGEPSAPVAPPSAAAKTLRLAVVQMRSDNGDVAGNLARATPLAEEAAAGGARLIVFPEFMPGGYSLAADAWDAGEPADGPTARWLTATADRLDAYVGTSFLEAQGDRFFNTFILAGPEGKIVGGVRKQHPAGAEGFFFEGEVGPHVIDTAVGRIGVGICQEAYRCFLAKLLREQRPDLVVMPFSFPDMSASGGLASPPGTHVASWYAAKLGVPTAMINKVGDWKTATLKSPTDPITGRFPGQSAVVDSDGAVRALLGGEAAVGVADVILDPARKRADGRLCEGDYVADLTLGGPMTRAFMLLGYLWQGVTKAPTLESQAAAWYRASEERRRRALAVSAG